MAVVSFGDIAIDVVQARFWIVVALVRSGTGDELL